MKVVPSAGAVHVQFASGIPQWLHQSDWGLETNWLSRKAAHIQGHALLSHVMIAGSA